MTDERLSVCLQLPMKVVLLSKKCLLEHCVASGYGDNEEGLAYSFLPVYLVSPIMSNCKLIWVSVT